VQSLIVVGGLLLAWALLCFWAGLGFAFVAALLLLVALAAVALVGGHRFVHRWYVLAEIAALIAAAVLSGITGFAVGGVVFAMALGVDTIVCSVLVLWRGRGAIRTATRNLLMILATLGFATGASAVIAAIVPVPSCGTATIGAGGATSPGSAAAGQCFVAAAETCIARTLTVAATGLDELARHQYRVVLGSDGQCHFTDTVRYGPPSNPTRRSASYTCPALTAQVGAPGEQEVQLSQCTGAVLAGAGEPIIPMNAYRPLPSSSPSPG
jgi:hypothetical protein